jgi:hypothetical protein
MVDIALSRDDLYNIFGGKLNIYTYDQIKKFKTIDELLGKYGRAIILYFWQNSPRYGHWTAVHRLTNGDIEFFDSFSSKPDHEFKDIPKNFRMSNGMDYPYLTKLLFECPYPIHYNNKPIQDDSSSCCGRYCSIRIASPYLTIDEFNKLWGKDKKKNDLLSVKLTDN